MLVYGGATTEQCRNCEHNSIDGCLFYTMTGRPAIIVDDANCVDYKPRSRAEIQIKH